MKKLKYDILFLVFIISIGVAIVSTELNFEGSIQMASQPSDFIVYFSDVIVDGQQDLSLVKTGRTLEFSKEFMAVGDKIEIAYDVTNASRNYDADVRITCTNGSDYLSVLNEFDTSNYLEARSTKTGILTITLVKSYSGETALISDFLCTLEAVAVERTSLGEASVPARLAYDIGDVVFIGSEEFNVLEVDEGNVRLLAKYNIDNKFPYKQTEEIVQVSFSNSNGWEYYPGPKDINIQNFDGETKTLLNSYVELLNNEYNIDANIDLISLRDLKSLGCTINEKYYIEGMDFEDYLCNNSPHKDWIFYGQNYWTKSAFGSDYGYNMVWTILKNGTVYDFVFSSKSSVRPVITISKEDLKTIS